jgi:hypothetical protein
VTGSRSGLGSIVVSIQAVFLDGVRVSLFQGKLHG